MEENKLQIKPYDKDEAFILKTAAVYKDMVIIPGDKESYEAVKAGARAHQKIRTSIENTRTGNNKIIKQLTDQNNGKASKLHAVNQPYEDRLKEEKQKEDDRIQAIKDAEAQQELDRIERIKVLVDSIMVPPSIDINSTSGEILLKIEACTGYEILEDLYQEFTEDALIKKDQVLKDMEEILVKVQQREQQEKEAKELQERLDKQKIEQEEREEQLKKEREKLEAEQIQRDRILKYNTDYDMAVLLNEKFDFLKEQAKIKAKADKEDEERRKKHAEAQAKIDAENEKIRIRKEEREREEFERKAREEAKVEAESLAKEKAVQELIDEAAKVKAEKEAAERQEALKPEIDKAKDWLEMLESDDPPDVENEELEAVLCEINAEIKELISKAWITLEDL